MKLLLLLIAVCSLHQIKNASLRVSCRSEPDTIRFELIPWYTSGFC